MTPRETTGAGRFLGWRMVALAFAAFNLCAGIIAGSFGAVLSVLQHDLGASRGAISSGFGLVYLAIGVLSPVVGNLLERFSIRMVMTTGAVLCAAGFAMLAYARSLAEVLIIFAGPIGVGYAVLGVVAPPTLVNRWFDHARGKALGIAMMPLAILVWPPVAAMLVARGGRALMLLAVAAMFVVLLPLLRLVVDTPAQAGQQPLAAAAPEERRAGIPAAEQPTLPWTAIFGDLRFWLLSVGIGVLVCTAIAYLSHGVAIAGERGVPSTLGAVLISSYGGGTLLGALVFGALIDRIGPFTTLVINAITAAAMWFLLLSLSAFPPMMAAATILGMCGGATFALHSAAITSLFGAGNFSRAIGYSYLIKLPFLFGGAPIAGFLYDHSGNYRSTLLVAGGSLLGATILFAALTIRRREVRRPVPLA